MVSRIGQTLVEPSIFKLPVTRTNTLTTSRIAAILKSIESTSKISAISTTATGSLISPTTITVIPPVRSSFDSPLAAGKDPTPAIAIITLVAVILCALILLLVLFYCIFLRFRGYCPNCPRYEKELKKWKNGNLKVVRLNMVQERMRACDLEKGVMDLQAQMFKDQMHMQSLACLEGWTHDERSSDGRVDSLWSEEPIVGKKEKDNVVESLQTKPQETSPAHIVAAVAQLEGDAEATLVNSEFPKTHSAYLKEVVAPREVEAKRSLQEGEEQAINRQLDIASDPSNRESVQERAMNKAKCMIMERDAKHNDIGRPQLPVPRKDGESRFKEHFSCAMSHDLE